MRRSIIILVWLLALCMLAGYSRGLMLPSRAASAPNLLRDLAYGADPLQRMSWLAWSDIASGALVMLFAWRGLANHRSAEPGIATPESHTTPSRSRSQAMAEAWQAEGDAPIRALRRPALRARLHHNP